MAKAHPPHHRHRKDDGECQGREHGSLDDQVRIADECGATKERYAQGHPTDTTRHAHLQVVPEEVSYLPEEYPRWSTSRGRGHGDHLLFLGDQKVSSARKHRTQSTLFHPLLQT